MLKPLVFTLSLVSLVAVGGYFYIRSRLLAAPEQIREALKAHEITLAWGSALVPPIGLSIKLNAVHVAGIGSQAALTASSVHLSLIPALAWPPLKARLKLEDANLPQYGFSHLNGSLSLNYDDQTIEARDQEVSFGPFVLQASGRFDLKSHKWHAALGLPNHPLGMDSPAINRDAKWLKTIAGELMVKIEAQGIGNNTDTLNCDGKISANGLALQIEDARFKGQLSTTFDLDLLSTQAHFKGNLKTDADAFLTMISQNLKGILQGNLNVDTDLTSRGWNTDAIRQSIRGTGNYSLTEGQLATFRLAEKPIQALKQVPGLSHLITQQNFDEKIKLMTGTFKVEPGRLVSPDSNIHGTSFDAVAVDTVIGFDQMTVAAKVFWTPTNSAIPTHVIDAIKNENGRTGIPILVSGNLQSPRIAIDQPAVETMLKNFATAQVDNLFKGMDLKAQNDLKKRIGEGLKKLFH